MHGFVSCPSNHHSCCFPFQRPCFRSPSLQWIVTRHASRVACGAPKRVAVTTGDGEDALSRTDVKSQPFAETEPTGSAKVAPPLQGPKKPVQKTRLDNFQPRVGRKRYPPRRKKETGGFEAKRNLNTPPKAQLKPSAPPALSQRRKGLSPISRQEMKSIMSTDKPPSDSGSMQSRTLKPIKKDQNSSKPSPMTPQPSVSPSSQSRPLAEDEVEEREKSPGAPPDGPSGKESTSPDERKGTKKLSMVEGGVPLGDLSQYRQSAFEFVEEQQAAESKANNGKAVSTSDPGSSTSSSGLPPGFDPNDPNIPDFDMSDLDLSKLDQKEVKEVLDDMMSDDNPEEGMDMFTKENFFASEEEMDRKSKPYEVNAEDFFDDDDDDEGSASQQMPSASDKSAGDDGEGGFDMDELFGTDNLDEILEKLGAAADEEDQEEAGEKGVEGKAKPSEQGDDEDDGDPNVQPEIDLTFTEDEARMFVEKMKNVDLNDLLEGKTNLIGEFEDTVGKNLKAPGYEDVEWENPYEKLIWEVTHYLFPRRGKKPHRQNWAHMHVSDEVKEKRRRKKAKGFAIWLSMEITKASKSATKQLQTVQHGSEEAKSITEKCIREFMGFLNGYTSKFTLWHFGALIQRFALVASRGGLQEWILMVYPSLFVTLIAGIRSRVDELDARQISELVWAFGKLGPKVFDVEGAVMELDIIPDRSNVDVKGFYGDLIKRAMEIAEEFGPSDVASFAYGVAIMPGPLQNAGPVGILIEASAAKMDEFNAQDMSNLCWSMVKLGIEDRDGFIGKLVRHAETKVPMFNSHSYSMLVKSLGHMGRDDCESLLTRIINEIKYQDSLKDFKPKELANFGWGMAKLRHYPPAWFLAAFEDVCLSKLEKFNGPTMCVLLLAFAAWGVDSPRLTSACKVKLLFTTDALSSRDLVNSAWSFAVLGLLDDEYISFCVDQLNRMDCNDVKIQELRQLRQCAMDAAIFSPGSNAMDDLSEELVGASRAAWEEGQLSYETPAEVQQALDVLSTSGLKCESRAWLKDKTFVSSMVEIIPGVKYLIEVKLPGCRFQNQPQLSIGKVRWREKLLASLGYSVLQLDPTAWAALDTDEAKLKYLNNMI